MTARPGVSGFAPDFSRKHGCAWLVWPAGGVHRPAETSGWASIGGEPAFLFQRLSDLPKNVVWWTNLSKAEAWSVGRLAHIKASGFMGPEWSFLMSEWGKPTDTDSLKTLCASWSEVFARIGEWLARWAARHGSGSPPPPWSWGDGDFHEALADRLGWALAADATHPALAEAFLDTVDMDRSVFPPAGQRSITFGRPRVDHASDLWRSRFPAGDFEQVPASQWPLRPDARWDWLAAQRDPVLVRFDEVLWRPGQTHLAELWWGTRGRRFAASAMDPVWLTAEDALDMRAHIDADPVDALVCSAGWTSQATVPGFPSSSDDWMHRNSIMGGLLAEALWRAAATPVRTPTRRIKSGVSPRAVWWRAADRRIMFQHAAYLQNLGFQVSSYGQGAVTVLFNPDRPPDWSLALADGRFAVPISLAPHAKKPITLNAAAADVWLKAAGRMESWLWVDRLLWPWIGADKASLRPILETSLRCLSEIEMPDPSWSTPWKSEIKTQARAAVQAINES